MKGATYGAKGGLFPVKSGQVWRVGQHLVACGDLEKGDGARLLLRSQPERPSLFYVDPPWSPAYITRFRRGADVAEDPACTVESLCTRVFELAFASSCPLLMEMGTTYEPEQVIAWAQRVLHGPGYPAVHVEPITYGGGLPARLFGFGLSEAQAVDLTCLRNTDDERTPLMAMNLFTEPEAVVVDLCLGLGATTRAAAMSNRWCWGLELHPRRCSVALADLRKICGEEPCLIGEL